MTAHRNPLLGRPGLREMRADLRMAVWRAGEIARALWHAARHPAG